MKEQIQITQKGEECGIVEAPFWSRTSLLLQIVYSVEIIAKCYKIFQKEICYKLFQKEIDFNQ